MGPQFALEGLPLLELTARTFSGQKADLEKIELVHFFHWLKKVPVGVTWRSVRQSKKWEFCFFSVGCGLARAGCVAPPPNPLLIVTGVV